MIRVWGYSYNRPLAASHDQEVVPQATITVYEAGTVTPVTLFADALGSAPLANPCTSDVAGYFFFYTHAQRVDVQISGGIAPHTVTTPYTLGDLTGGEAGSLYGWFNVRDYGAVGDGLTNDRAAFDAARVAATALTNGAAVIVPAGTYRLGSSLTMDADVNVWAMPGAIISNDAGATLTILGSFIGDISQHFAGAGLVDLTSAKIECAYAEWWGIDGVADDVQINQALVAARRVVSLDKRYYQAAYISVPSNREWDGAGSDRTVLDWTGGAVGNMAAKVRVLNADNVKLSGFTIDGQSADATILAGSGLLVDDGSTNVTIEDVHAYDCYRHGILVNTGSNIHLRRCKVSLGCTSSAVLLGQFPAAYGLSTNQNLSDVWVDDLLIDTVKSDAMGIWNCSGGDGFSSTCRRIETHGLIVKDWGRAGLGYAYWGSGITTYAEDVNLNNFSFDNTNAGALNIGRGLHIEFGVNWTHNNGTMRNLITGVADDKLGYGITCAGGNSLAYSNIEMYLVGIGVLCNGSTDATFEDIQVRYGKYAGYYVGGTHLHFTNCHAFSTGAVTPSQLSWLIYAAAPLTVDDVTMDGCSGSMGAPVVGTAYPITVSATAMTGMRITNFSSGNGVILDPGANRAFIHGETFAVRLRETVPAGTDYEIPLLVDPASNSSRRLCILNAWISFSAGIPVSVGDYAVYKLIKRDANGINPVELTTVGLSTKDDDFSAAFKARRFPINDKDNAHVAASEILTLSKAKTNAGQPEADGLLTIEYVSY